MAMMTPGEYVRDKGAAERGASMTMMAGSQSSPAIIVRRHQSPDAWRLMARTAGGPARVGRAGRPCAVGAGRLRSERVCGDCPSDSDGTVRVTRMGLSE